MCGVAGYFGPALLQDDRIAACKTLMHRRGPDAVLHRHWTNSKHRHAYLLHSRLSIIDADARSNQPLGWDGRWLIFNGELYNYREIRAELEAKGEVFTTNSDTEVLLRAITTWGWEVLDRLEGMWAFALFDERDGSLTLCRDRFGEKPLYLISDHSGGVYFGSEVKFLVALLGHRLEINHDQVWRYLVNGYKALYKKSATFFKGVKELPPRAFWRFDAAGIKTTQTYWTPRYEPLETMSYPEIVKGVKERLIRSMEIRLRADVPMAFCMSGGVDSNTLISIAKRVFGYDVHGFTVANTDARYEEQELVDVMVRELGLRHTSMPLDSTDFLAKLKTLIVQHDAPVYTITYYAHWLLMQNIAKGGYRISVSGTGADELLTGYYDHHLAYLYEIRKDPLLAKSARSAWEQHIQRIVQNPFLGDPDLFVKDPAFRAHIFLGAEQYSTFLNNRWYEEFEEQVFSASLLRNRMMNEMFEETVPPTLHEDDLNAMYFSIENRSPFLDRQLFDFCYRIPSQFLMRDGYTKVVLRDAMRGIVPDPILDSRRKVGFNAPMLEFLDARDPGVRNYVLQDSPIYNYVEKEKIVPLLDKGVLPNSESKFLFNFVNSKIFLEQFGA